jgi:hypothetical protein
MPTISLKLLRHIPHRISKEVTKLAFQLSAILRSCKIRLKIHEIISWQYFEEILKELCSSSPKNREIECLSPIKTVSSDSKFSLLTDMEDLREEFVRSHFCRTQECPISECPSHRKQAHLRVSTPHRMSEFLRKI